MPCLAPHSPGHVAIVSWKAFQVYESIRCLGFRFLLSGFCERSAKAMIELQMPCLAEFRHLQELVCDALDAEYTTSIVFPLTSGTCPELC